MVSPNLGEIVTTTLRNRSGKLADNVTNNLALLYRLKEKGNMKPVSGGRTIVQEIEYAENGTFAWYSGYDTLNISPSDVFTAAEYDWKQCSVAVTWSGLEIDIQNTGKEQVIDLLESRISNAEKTMMNNMADAVYSDGSANGGKQLGGLQLLVSDAGTGTVGGINSTTWSFWQNYVFDFSAQSLTPGTATIQQAMNTAWLNTKRNRDVVDLIVADNTYYRYYWESLQAIQRITNTKMAEAGFENLKFQGADVIPDGGKSGSCPANHMYGINSSYLFYRPHRDRNMVPLDPTRFSTNQDAAVRLLAFAGNMTTSNRSLQFAIVA